MAFQLVLVTDSEVTVWHTDFGHIYGFAVDPPGQTLLPRFTREAADATEPAGGLQEEAHRFATELARSRRLIA